MAQSTFIGDFPVEQNRSRLGKLKQISYHYDFIHGCFLTILVYIHRYSNSIRRYLIGYEVANTLGKKTSNLYRSLRNQGIALDCLSEKKIKDLISRGILTKGTSSVTLIPFAEGCVYLSDCKINDVEQTANILLCLSKNVIK